MNNNKKFNKKMNVLMIQNELEDERKSEIQNIEHILLANDYEVIDLLTEENQNQYLNWYFGTIIADKSLIQKYSRIQKYYDNIIKNNNPKQFLYHTNNLDELKRLNDYFCDTTKEYNKLEMFDPKKSDGIFIP